MSEAEKKPMTTQRITVIIAAVMLGLGGISSVANWVFDFTGKYQDWRDKQTQRTIDQNAKIVSDSTVAKVIREIDPLKTADFDAFRDSLHNQIRNGKHIALSYMTAVDSLIQIVSYKDQEIGVLNSRVQVLEVKLQVAKANTRDEGLNMVMNTLEKLLNEKSSTQKLDSIMIGIRQINENKLNIKSGDRAQ